MTRHTHNLINFNIDNYRPDQGQLAEELHAINEQWDPFLIFCIEAIGNRLPRLDGMTLLQDDSTPSRANIAVYVDKHARHTGLNWIDLKTTWPRTEGPGIHPPRSFPWLVPNGLQAIGVHQAPKNAKTVMEAQREGIEALESLMGRGVPTRASLALGDFNRSKTDLGPGPATLAKAIGGKVLGERIMCGVGKNLGLLHKSTYHTSADGIPIKADHGNYQRVRISWQDR